MVREYSQKRKAIQIAGKIIDQAQAEDISKTLHDGIHELMAVEDDQADEDNGEITPLLVDLFADCEKDLGEIVGIPSGFAHLDRLKGGFQESDLVIIGARPSMGKTVFALNLALHVAFQDVSVVFFLEMGKVTREINQAKKIAKFTKMIFMVINEVSSNRKNCSTGFFIITFDWGIRITNSGIAEI